MKLGKRVQLVTKQNAGESTDLLSPPARVMSVVVKGHGRVEGRKTLKGLVRVSIKCPPQLVGGALHKGVSAECRCRPTSFDVEFVVVTRDGLEAKVPLTHTAGCLSLMSMCTRSFRHLG